MTYRDAVLACDMNRECAKAVTHIDNKGFVYCTDHGELRKLSRRNCRKLRPHEVNRLKRGEQVIRY
jgi:hypothetical protein